MKERILTKWTFTRILFLIVGIAFIAQSVMSRQWYGILFGGYFASMGLFAFGCASGNCYTGYGASTSKQKRNTVITDVEFEEVKTK